MTAFEPEWSSPPGETIADILGQRRLSARDFALRMDLTIRETRDLIEGRSTITAELASKLERFLGSTATFWSSREAQYRADLARIAGRQFGVAEQNWLLELPVADMIRFGWVPLVSSASEKLEACRRFFGVRGVSDWRTRPEVAAAFRASPTFKSQPGSVSAWLRQGEVESAPIVCQPWNVEIFQEMLPTIRSLTFKRNPASFIPELQNACATCGVAVVVVRAPSKCHVSGASRFVTPDRALLQLSFRYLSDDQFWFTFFHEAGHLVLHSKELLFLEGKDASATVEEHEANEFAARMLVPYEFRSEMLSLPPYARPVIRFAQRIGISPGVVVGQMQHHGRIGRDQLNKLKRRFAWG